VPKWDLGERPINAVSAQRITMMYERMIIKLACALLGAAVVTGCTAGPAAPSYPASHQGGTRHARTGHARTGHAARTAAPTSPRPVTRAAARQCPRTIFSHVVAPPGTSPADLVPGTTAYGNGKLLVAGLSVHGVIVAGAGFIHPDGSISWKFPWWRLARGHLTVTGRRLDAPAPPMSSRVPNGYGDIGFQATGVTFPSEGCWQITGRTARTSLTFVILVVTEAHRALARGG